MHDEPVNSTLERELLLATTRRHFFHDCRVGLGALALSSLLSESKEADAEESPSSEINAASSPLAPRQPHFTPKAKAVIFLFMAGGPSQLELFDYKPKLQELHGQVIPESFVANKRFAFIKRDAKLLGTKREFSKKGGSGAQMSSVIPHLHSIADELCILRGMVTDVFNHGPAKLFMNSGSPSFSGRPSMGSWLTYGIGSECQNLPGFVVLQSGPRGPRGGAALWSSGFLPTAYQGVPLRTSAEPILNLNSPPGISKGRQRDFVSAVNDLNRARLQETGDPEIATRISAYEMAFQMQSSAPELIDLSSETKATLDAYGVTSGKPSYAMNCLLARRLVERGVRFVQLYHTDWDHHGNIGTELGPSLDERCKEVDQPTAALIKDLKERGLLDQTIVLWGGEFGRTPQGEPRELIGRDHHIDAFTMLATGGGIKTGQTIGVTDEIGYNVVDGRVHVHDLHATMLHLLGINHKQLTFRFQGRDFRLTDVHGELVPQMMA